MPQVELHSGVLGADVIEYFRPVFREPIFVRKVALGLGEDIPVVDCSRLTGPNAIDDCIRLIDAARGRETSVTTDTSTSTSITRESINWGLWGTLAVLGLGALYLWR